MKQFQFLLLIIFIFLIYSCKVTQPENIDLSGEWKFQMDPDDVGVKEEWYNRELSDSVHLPGSMVENGKGYDITLDTKWTGGIKNPEWYKDPNYAPYFDSLNIRFPYWLQPEKKYTAAAWYQKKVIVPDSWDEKNVTRRRLTS